MSLTFRRKGLSLAAAFVAASLFAAPALAQATQPTQESQEEGIPTQWMTAIRGGAGINEKDVVGALVWQSPAMGPNKYLRFRPAVFGSFSSDRFEAGVNVDFAVETRIPGSMWSLLFGAGVSVLDGHAKGGGNRLLGGGDLIVGFQRPDGLFGEIRLVGSQSHTMELVVGYFFNQGKK
jgi:hypothetical protein